MIENLARDFWSPDGCQKCEAGLRNEYKLRRRFNSI